MLLCVHSSIAIILMGKSDLVALLNLSSWCLVMVERLFLAMLRSCLRFVIVVFPDHTHLLILLKRACLIWLVMRTALLSPQNIIKDIKCGLVRNVYIIFWAIYL